MKIDWKKRIENPLFLTSVASLIAITGQTFGLYQVPVEWDAWVNSILTVLSVMGIINNPLTTGLND